MHIYISAYYFNFALFLLLFKFQFITVKLISINFESFKPLIEIFILIFDSIKMITHHV